MLHAARRLNLWAIRKARLAVVDDRGAVLDQLALGGRVEVEGRARGKVAGVEVGVGDRPGGGVEPDARAEGTVGRVVGRVEGDDPKIEGAAARIEESRGGLECERVGADVKAARETGEGQVETELGN